MQTHYEHYLLGCRETGVKPLSFWRFRLAYGKFQREVRAKLDRHWDSLSPKDRHQLLIECRWLIEIDNLVQKGAKIAELAARERDGGDEPGTAGAGTREPRIPISPVLAGCAARPLPTSDTLKDSYDWRL